MDQATWDLYDNYYKPIVGLIDMFSGKKFQRILDIGYGCGILIPSLAQYANQVSGIDIHDNHLSVNAMLKTMGVQSDLKKGDILQLPYPDSSFDAIVCGSVLEHLTPADLLKAINEISRVTTKGADIVLGFPVKNRVTDTIFKLLGYVSDEIHPSNQYDIYHAIQSQFKIIKRRQFPYGFPLNYSFYTVCHCVKDESKSLY
jgi:ubiquinone/menaquinone biosynthesis C-methylase UbiE